MCANFYSDEKLSPDLGQEGRRISNKRHNSCDCSQPPGHHLFGGFLLSWRWPHGLFKNQEIENVKGLVCCFCLYVGM